ncbi:MAG TPA: response regulator [Verrucomicrobia bacterium]|nr:response regulator [Verrucomicrobiota bacterium]HOB31978.1 response regulator [Verrucomicrobiota bacterium]HOP97436.1 response regulator [Verrucomicrobiota bacterium]HPU54695.1 response regulator [Verrucomicrobiota bacterium]
MSDHVILLVEDNEDDVFFLERAVKKAGITAPVHVARDGQQAIDYLSGTGQYGDRSLHPLPTIVFLDLKLPYVHGFDVLAWVRKHDALGALPIVVLTSSAEERDRTRAEELGCVAYLVKPAEPPALARLMQCLKPGSAPPATGSPASGQRN